MIIISPYAKPLINGKQNPKNYPYWKELITFLKEPIIQIGVEGEEKLVEDFRIGLPLKEIEKLVRDCTYWISVDNFLPHLAHHIKKVGIVLWSVSDPKIFGYPENLNILKSRDNLRPDQFNYWEQCEYNENVYLSAQEVFYQMVK